MQAYYIRVTVWNPHVIDQQYYGPFPTPQNANQGSQYMARYALSPFTKFSVVDRVPNGSICIVWQELIEMTAPPLPVRQALLQLGQFDGLTFHDQSDMMHQ